MDETTENVELTRQYVSFELQGEEYGIPILHVKEIIRYTTLTHIPESPHFVEGVLNLRGQVIPVINLRRKFDLDECENDNSTRIIVVDIGKRVVGIVVDEVSEVLQINADEISPAPPMGTTLNTDFITGMGKVNEQLVILLKVEKIISLKEDETIMDTGEN